TAHYTNDELPTHPSLRLLHDLPQRVSLKVVRRLIVMEKTRPAPFPRPSRAVCAATRQARDLRALMDATELPDNSDYMHYRAKLMRKREATRQYFSATASAANNNTATCNDDGTKVSSSSSSSDALLCGARPSRKKMSKTERQ
ncbi:methyltransferase, partial [Trypanosoma grayi]|uniref:methyltransferase n=1 Tax=Trypanosoma grayi TaxID=71804 RepID=UPI0004F3FFF0